MAKAGHRRLSAIVVAQVSDRERLISADEEGMRAILRGHRLEVIDPKVAEHGGRLADTADDRLRIGFGDAFEALRFAMALQKGIAEQNADIPEQDRVVYRVGIDFKDRVERNVDPPSEGGDVAARIESLAEPGGIYLSAAARERVGDKIDIDFDDLGELRLENLPKPVRVYRARFEGVRDRAWGLRAGYAVLGMGIVLMATLSLFFWWLAP